MASPLERCLQGFRHARRKLFRNRLRQQPVQLFGAIQAGGPKKAVVMKRGDKEVELTFSWE